MSGKTIKLSTPINWHRGQIKEIILREPKYRDYMKFGEPTTWVSVNEGGAFLQENVQTLARWIEELADCEVTALDQLSLKDTLALRGAVRGFFIPSQDEDKTGKTESPPSTDSSDGSSSSTESTSGPSTI